MYRDGASVLEGVWGDGVPKPKMAYSPAVRAGDWLFVSGQLASDFATGLSATVIPENPYLVSPLALQARFVLSNIAATVAPTGTSLTDGAVRLSRWFTSAAPGPAGGAAWSACGVEDEQWVEAQEFVPANFASSTLGIRALMVKGTELELDVIARLDGSPTEPVVSAGGSRVGVRRGDWVFLDSRSHSDGAAGVGQQTERILDDLEAFAETAGASFRRAVRAEVFLRDVRDQPTFERVWSQRFNDNGPSRVVVPSVAPRDPLARVEIALTLVSDESSMRIEAVETSSAPAALGGGPQAVLAGDLLFFSTQMAVDSSGEVVAGARRSDAFPWYGSPGKAQMRIILDNVSAICEAAGTNLENVVRRVCYHEDLQWFGESIAEWACRFPGLKPASTTLELAGPLGAPGANTLLDLIAYVPEVGP